MTQANLKIVMKQLMSSSKLSANALAKSLNLPTPTIQRLLTGEVQDPRASTLTAIADYFDISVDQLLGREALAKRFEGNTQSIARPPNSVPIFSLSEIENAKPSKTSSHWLRWQNQYNLSPAEFEQLFAVLIKNDLYQPVFSPGTFLIINPVIQSQSGDYVLVKFSNDPLTNIKKYISEGGQKYLYSLKQDVKTITLEKNKCKIIGVITESYVNFKSMEV